MGVGDVKSVDMSPEVDGKWKDAYSSAGALGRSGDYINAVEKIDLAWNLMPEPKLLCSRAHITLVRRVKFYSLAKKYNEAIDLASWAIENSPRQKIDVPIFLVLKGGPLLDSGRPDEAFLAFDAAWREAGDYGFDDDQSRYLDFYKTRSDRD
ncbi:hypothetical protein [Lysobacter capsici]|uniref:hypothetical protein n=1 Tax=Lysobacter capsici TaxID=435897 RepID=UPI001290889E|nr:hypothetical protein [Lysobacter capsici]